MLCNVMLCDGVMLLLLGYVILCYVSYRNDLKSKISNLLKFGVLKILSKSSSGNGLVRCGNVLKV